ncbi:MAG: alpha-mannosidase [Victivallaceae bacterium]|nr:glycoside hydrolase family 38 C-terminal domain-containing protein [Victivallaceae bacterium]
MFSHIIDTFLMRIQRDWFSVRRPFEIKMLLPGIGGKPEYYPVRVGEIWGKNYECANFILTGVIPEEWGGHEIVGCINSGGETMVLDGKGVPSDALTDASVFDRDYKKELIRLFKKANGGEVVAVHLECTANGLFGMDTTNDPDVRVDPAEGSFVSAFRKAYFGCFNRELYGLYHDVNTLLSFYKYLKSGDARGRKIEAACNRAIDIYCCNPANAAEARKALSAVLAWPASGSAVEVTAVGHAHIDTAWLWPLEQTVKKIARTFAGQLALMKEYKGYVFGASSAYHYEICKQEYPELYLKVKDAVKKGTWELQGGLFVEADCNMPNGESLIRQFLYGKNFFKEEFGIEVNNLWLPDVFGYPGSLPQIIKKCGCDFFLTQKISWSDTNKFPYHSFVWKGIDGTGIFTHFPPEDTYNAYMCSSRLLTAQDNYAQTTVNNEFLSLYGIGDGGAGPSQDFVERALRLRDFEGAPKVKFGRACDFFDRMAKKDGYPDWNGELYLELHRGTYTTQARNKRGNRFAEQQLLELETLFAMLPVEKYPESLLDMLWKTVLINQFHDIIPGSSVHRVYEESSEDYNAVFEMLERLRGRFEAEASTRDEDSITLVNTLSTPVRELVPLDWAGAESEGVPVAVECGEALVDIPALGTKILCRATGKKLVRGKKKSESLVLENELIRYEFDENGMLVSVYDKELDREFLEGKGNVFTLYADYPVNYEAWEIDAVYRNQKVETAHCIEISKICDGSLFGRLRLRFTVGASTIDQQVTLLAGEKMLSFETGIEWNESRKMLRVGFETTVDAPDAAYDIQFGYIKRANHTNTSWEKAKFEQPHQRYFDLSNADFGIAVLNDCKYGCRVAGREIDLALLRAPKYPDFHADIGSHKLTYAILPHRGALIDSNVMEKAANLNRHARVFKGIVRAEMPFVLEGGTVELSALKRGYRTGNRILRLAETQGRNTKTTVVLKTSGRLIETNMIEWSRGKAFSAPDNRIELEFKPFEVRTFIME